MLTNLIWFGAGAVFAWCIVPQPQFVKNAWAYLLGLGEGKLVSTLTANTAPPASTTVDTTSNTAPTVTK